MANPMQLAKEVKEKAEVGLGMLAALRRRLQLSPADTISSVAKVEQRERRQRMRRLTVTTALLAVLVPFVALGNNQSKQVQQEQLKELNKQKRIEAFMKKYGTQCQIAWDDVCDCVKSIDGEFSTGRQITDEKAARRIAEDFIQSNSDILGVTLSDLRLNETHFSSYLARYRVDYFQYYHGLRVEKSRLRIFIREDGTIYAVRNSCFTGIQTVTTPTISDSQAVELARALYDSPFKEEGAPSTELVVFPVITENSVVYFLAWRVQFIGMTFFMDAKEGKELERWDNIRRQTTEYTYSGVIRGTTYPLTNPQGDSTLTPLQYVYIWLDQQSPTHSNSSGATGAYGDYTIVKQSPQSLFYTRLESDIVRVYNDQGVELEHWYSYGDPVHDYDFPASPGDQANVYYNVITAWNWFKQTYPDHSQPFIDAYANVLMDDYGSSNGSIIWIRTDSGPYSWVIQHEFSHCVAYRMAGGTWLNYAGPSWDCLDEAYAVYYPCAILGTPVYRKPSETVDITQATVSDEDSDGTITEDDHHYYNNRYAVAGAWWDLRSSLGVSRVHQMMRRALEQVAGLTKSKKSPRDLFNEMLKIDDDDGNPANGTPHLDAINTAFKNHGMNYYPRVQTVDASGTPKDVFKAGETVYCIGQDLPTNQEVQIYVVRNNDKWTNGASLLDLSGGFETVTTDGAGRFPPTAVWTPTSNDVGSYDIIVDVDKNLKFDFDFNDTIDACDNIFQPGFTVGSPVDIVLIIDRSGSMGYYGYMEPAKNAATTFVGFMQNGDQIAVVSFSSTASVNFPLTLITSNATRTAAQNAISWIYSSGTTSIGAGLQTGQNQLNTKGRTLAPWAMILLSDGEENTPPWVDNVLPSIPDKTDVYTIALGPSAGQALLQHIASATGGNYYYSPTADQLRALYSHIKGRATGQQILWTQSGNISQGATQSLSGILIDSSTSQVTFSVTWGGSDIDLVLIDPNGSIIDPSSANTNPEIDFISGPSYEYFVINSPLAGQWGMRITGVSIPPGGERYTAMVTAYAKLKLEVAFGQERYYTGEPVLVLAEITELGYPIVGASVTADISRPGTDLFATLAPVPESPQEHQADTGDQAGQPGVETSGNASDRFSAVTLDDPAYVGTTITLYDDGMHGDGAANDGVYGNYYGETQNPGSYSFSVNALGTNLEGEPFTRKEMRSVYVERATHNIAVTAILAPVDTIIAGTVVVPAVTVQNFGLVAETFPVTFTFDGYSSARIVSNLAAGAVDTVEFDPWVAVPGSYNITAYAELASDQNPINNTIHGSFYVEATLWRRVRTFNWQMLSIPGCMDDSRREALLDDDFGPVCPNPIIPCGWNCFWWDGSRFVIPDSLRCGRAFWVYLRPDTTGGQVPELTARVPVPNEAGNSQFEIPLHNGWNQIATPRQHAVGWNNDIRVKHYVENCGYVNVPISVAEIFGWVKSTLWWFNPDSHGFEWWRTRDGDGALLPWEGYYVLSFVDSCWLLIPPSDGLMEAQPTETWQTLLTSEEEPSFAWLVQLKVSSGNYSDTKNFIGVSKDASDGLDLLDVEKPMGLPPYIRLSFAHPEWGSPIEDYAQDIRSISQETHTWHLKVERAAVSEGIATLEWTKIADQGLKNLTLADPVAGVSIDMISNGRYELTWLPGENSRVLSIVAIGYVAGVPDADGKLSTFKVTAIQPNPSRGALTISYIVPIGGCEVKFSVYDVEGRAVASLSSTHTQPGEASIVWDGTDRTRRKVSPGVYFCTVECRGQVVSKKVILIQ